MTVQACAEIVERGDRDRFLAAMSCPVEAREVLFPIYAFNVEVSRAPWVTEEPMIAEIRIQWWREAMEEIGAGKEPRAHEVVQPLSGLIREQGLPTSLFEEAAQARRWECYKEPFEDEAHFTQHIERTAAHPTWAAALGLGAGAELEEPVRQVGRATGLANWLRAVPELESRGRYPLPDGRPEAVQSLAREALERLETVKRTDFGPAVPALRASWDVPRVLKLAARRPELVAQAGLEGAPAGRRLRLMWHAARGGW